MCPSCCCPYSLPILDSFTPHKIKSAIIDVSCFCLPYRQYVQRYVKHLSIYHYKSKTNPSSAQQRLSQVTSHLASSESDIPRGRETILAKSPNDVVVTCALRTPFTKGGKGQLKDTAAADLLVHTLKSVLARSKIDPSLVNDIAVGSVLPPGGGATEFRAASLVAGFPESTAVKSLNR